MDRQEAAAWVLVGAIRDAIREAGEEGIPSGHLYAMIMDKVSLESYNSVIDLLKRTGMISECNHLLKTCKIK